MLKVKNERATSFVRGRMNLKYEYFNKLSTDYRRHQTDVFKPELIPTQRAIILLFCSPFDISFRHKKYHNTLNSWHGTNGCYYS